MLHERKFSGLTCQWCYRTHLKKMEDVVNKKTWKNLGVRSLTCTAGSTHSTDVVHGRIGTCKTDR